MSGSSSSRPQAIRVARHAMATRFEMVLIGERPDTLRAAGEEALDEIERIENALSLYRPHTDIARINAGAASGPVRIAPETFRLLEHARDLSDRTSNAFDVTAGPLIRAWGFHGGSGHLPESATLLSARKASGWSRVVLDRSDGTVRFPDGIPGLLDLGAIGKGYALDRAAGILRDAGVHSALLHGGTSTVVALGTPPGEASWTVALASGPSPVPADPAAQWTEDGHPHQQRDRPSIETGHQAYQQRDRLFEPPPDSGPADPPPPQEARGTGSLSRHPDAVNRVPGTLSVAAAQSARLFVEGGEAYKGTGSLCSHRGGTTEGQVLGSLGRTFVTLRNETLSVSAVWGRAFYDADGRRLGHVVDPRTGFPVTGAHFAAVVLPSAAESDAVSTALLVLGRSGIPSLDSQFPGFRCWLDPVDGM